MSAHSVPAPASLPPLDLAQWLAGQRACLDLVPYDAAALARPEAWRAGWLAEARNPTRGISLEDFWP